MSPWLALQAAMGVQSDLLLCPFQAQRLGVFTEHARQELCVVVVVRELRVALYHFFILVLQKFLSRLEYVLSRVRFMRFETIRVKLVRSRLDD